MSCKMHVTLAYICVLFRIVEWRVGVAIIETPPPCSTVRSPRPGIFAGLTRHREEFHGDMEALHVSGLCSHASCQPLPQYSRSCRPMCLPESASMSLRLWSLLGRLWTMATGVWHPPGDTSHLSCCPPPGLDGSGVLMVGQRSREGIPPPL